MKRWPTLALLLTLFTGCDFLKNDFKDQPLPGVKVYDSRLPVGSSARAILSDSTFRTILVEMQAVSGFAPPQEAVNRVSDFLESVAHKSKIIFLPVTEVPARNVAAYTMADVLAMERTYRTHFSKRNQIALYFLFLDKPSADDLGPQRMLGQAYLNTSIVVYESSIKGLLAARPTTPRIGLVEATIMSHELGHVLGLVNNGAPAINATHHDGTHHCIDPTCLMSPNAETSALLDGGADPTQIPRLDPDCVRDLQAIGGR